MAKRKKSAWGGKRSGAGAKKTVPGGVPRTMVMSDDSWRRVRAESLRRATATGGRPSMSAVMESLAQSLPASKKAY